MNSPAFDLDIADVPLSRLVRGLATVGLSMKAGTNGVAQVIEIPRQPSEPKLIRTTTEIVNEILDYSEDMRVDTVERDLPGLYREYITAHFNEEPDELADAIYDELRRIHALLDAGDELEAGHILTQCRRAFVRRRLAYQLSSGVEEREIKRDDEREPAPNFAEE